MVTNFWIADIAQFSMRNSFFLSLLRLHIVLCIFYFRVLMSDGRRLNKEKRHVSRGKYSRFNSNVNGFLFFFNFILLPENGIFRINVAFARNTFTIVNISEYISYSFQILFYIIRVKSKKETFFYTENCKYVSRINLVKKIICSYVYLYYH